MQHTANFKVDSRLSSILGNGYLSCERALRELVDNAWDADALHVSITLPSIVSKDPIIISDDGHGMIEKELRQEYLNIANPRLSRKGDHTPQLNRLVKGRRGIGKFAGLVLADIMEVKTTANGIETSLVVDRKELEKGDIDIETVPLQISTAPCKKEQHGTTVILRELNSRLSFPDEGKLSELLARDYGKENSIEISINGRRVTNYDVHGETITTTIEIAPQTYANVTYTIADKPLPPRKAGLILREGNKSIGKPGFWGVENIETISPRLRNRIVGEIIVPHGSLELTASGADLLEGDKTAETISKALCANIVENLERTHTKEFNLAKARWQRDLNNRLSKLPEFRREIVRGRIERLVQRSYQEGEKEERITVLVNLVLDALEMDEYWTVCHTIEDSDKTDVLNFSKALHEFGLADLAFVANQTSRRLTFLKGLAELARNKQTLESQMHNAIADNLWMFGPEYSMMASNSTLATIVEEFIGEKYSALDSNHRPDLLLNGGPDGSRLLIEFKRPSITVNWDAEAQAKRYADVLGAKLNIVPKIFIIGGEVDGKMREEYKNPNIKFFSYLGLIAQAQSNLEWLISELQSNGMRS